MRIVWLEMTKDSQTLPHPDEIVSYLMKSPVPVSKQELSKHFKIQGKEIRQDFKILLKDLVKQGKIEKEKGRNYSAEATVPKTIRIKITEFNEDRMSFIGECIDEDVEGIKKAYIRHKDRPKARVNDCFVVRVLDVNNGHAQVKPLKLIYPDRTKLVGVVRLTQEGAIITPTNRTIKENFELRGDDARDLNDDDLVVISATDGRISSLIENLGPSDNVKNITLIAVHENNIRTEFSEDCIEQAKTSDLPPLKDRTDMREIPLVTIDGEDARDFDDAVYAEPTEHGYKIWVAIADVSYYVSHGSPLDKEAIKRGNSTYFPDRVVPMLPEHLSNGLCSINPDEERACMALEMHIDTHGKLTSKKIHRGLMKSHARLTYTQVQTFLDGGEPDEITPVKKHISHLFDAYKVLRKAREKRGALDIHGTEQKIIMNDEGYITDVTVREQNTANQVIEELMILSNVAVAELLEAKNAPVMYRIHEPPSLERITTLRDFIGGFGYKVPVSVNINGNDLNGILTKSLGQPEEFIIQESVLRSQSQARYAPENQGHFGLSLERYAHFTSPIRRYADLIVHRSLIRAYKLGKDGLTDTEISQLQGISEDISDAERRSVRAERDAMSRLTAIYLSEQEEQTFDGIISGVNDAGLFIRLPRYGAEGFIPIRTLPDDFYIHDQKSQSLIGRRTKRIYQLMASVKVRLRDIDPLMNNIIFEVADEFSAHHDGFSFSLPKSDRGNRRDRGGRRDKGGRGDRKDKRKPQKGSFSNKDNKNTKKNKHKKPKNNKKS